MNRQNESPDNFAPSNRSHDNWRENVARHRPSVIGLIVANAVPLIGVLIFGWSTFAIVALYWAENLVIGAINVLKIVFANPSLEQMRSGFQPKTGEEREHYEDMTKNWDKHSKAFHSIKLFLIPFFIAHYGIFCCVHGMFIAVLLSGDGIFAGDIPSVGGMLRLFTQEHLWWGVGALAISHSVSFYSNYLGQAEYKRTNPLLLMFQPYLRIVLLHVAIILGAFVAFALGSSVGVLVLLIVGKTALDLILHLREHNKYESSPGLLSLR